MNFKLLLGEKIIGIYEKARFFPSVIKTNGAAIGAAGGIVGGVGAGIYVGTQSRQVGNFWDSRPVNLYLTNKRLVMCSITRGLFSGWKEGTIMAEIELKK
jgi:hypothetical protein